MNENISKIIANAAEDYFAHCDYQKLRGYEIAEWIDKALVSNGYTIERASRVEELVEYEWMYKQLEK